MRTIYLIRHGEPDFPEGKKMCIGKTDLPLSRLGRMQGCVLGEALRGKTPGGVFSSPLRRAMQTAEYLGGATAVMGLEELDAGDWDGLRFDEIRERWPALYARRGEDRTLPPPNAESAAAGYRRFQAALMGVAAGLAGDAAVVSHRSVCVEFLAQKSGESRDALAEKLGYASVTELGYDGEIHVLRVGLVPRPPLSAALCARLLDAAGTPERVRAHCAAVSALAAEIAGELGLDAECAARGGLLHDIARTEPEHAEAGAALIARLGYPEEADMIRQHHMLRDMARIDEAAAVFLADKLLIGTQRVSLERRFEDSANRCLTAQAKQMHEERFQQARAVRDEINRRCGRQAIG